MQNEYFFEIISEITIGSTQSAITIKTFGEQQIIVPSDKVLSMYFLISKRIQDAVFVKNSNNAKLHELKNILLSKMTKV